MAGFLYIPKLVAGDQRKLVILSLGYVIYVSLIKTKACVTPNDFFTDGNDQHWSQNQSGNRALLSVVVIYKSMRRKLT